MDLLAFFVFILFWFAALTLASSLAKPEPAPGRGLRRWLWWAVLMAAVVFGVTLGNGNYPALSAWVTERYALLAGAGAALLALALTIPLALDPARFRNAAVPLAVLTGVFVTAYLGFRGGVDHGAQALAPYLSAAELARAEAALEATTRPLETTAVVLGCLAAYLLAAWIVRIAFTTPEFSDTIDEPVLDRDSAAPPG